MQKTYAKAIENLIKGGMSEAEVYTRLAAHLNKVGRTKLLPQLLRELKTLDAQHQGRASVLEVSSASEVKNAESEAGRHASTKAVINPALIRGWRLTTADTLIDRSGKRALIDLYRRVTH